MTTVQELDQKIKQGEILLAQEKMSGWMPLIGSLVIGGYFFTKILINGIYLTLTGLAFLYIAFNIWRVVNAQRNVKKLSARLQEYREMKAKLTTPNS
jgi:hypothetical protein